MALDRESIEKQDFPMARRGYDPEAVDTHLSAIAAEVEKLKRTVREGGPTLAGAASDQVRAIVEAAEATAAQIRGEAEAEAARIRGEARSDANAAQASAAAEAGERVAEVSQSASAMRERIEAIDHELGTLLDALRAGATRLGGELTRLQERLQETTSAGTPAPAEIEPEPPAPEPEPAPPEPAPRRSAPRPERASRASAAPAAKGTDHESARLIALSMALNRSTREEVDRYLGEHYELADQDTLLDEVFASVEG